MFLWEELVLEYLHPISGRQTRLARGGTLRKSCGDRRRCGRANVWCFNFPLVISRFNSKTKPYCLHVGRFSRLAAGLLCSIIALRDSAAAVVTRGPYLQSGTPSSIVIRWRTDAATVSQVRYGENVQAQDKSVVLDDLATEHEVRITGLAPDSQFFYTVGDGDNPLAGGDAFHSFRTAPLPGTVKPVRVWVLGDCGTAGYGSGDAEAVRGAYLSSPMYRHNDVWLMLGDNAYRTGRDDEYQVAVFDTYPMFLRNTVLWSALGNHETYSPDVPYFDIFTFPLNGEAGGVPSGTERYYSFDHANIHFVCLDSMSSDRRPGSAMLQWLEHDLESTAQKWIIAFWHHPPYTKGSHDSDYEIELIEMRGFVVPVLEAGGVDLVLAGHSHSYERSFLIDGHYGLSTSLTAAMIKDGGDGREDGAGEYGKDHGPHTGAVYAVAGTSGQISGGALNHPVMFTSLNELGSLVLDIEGDQLRASFLNSAGVIRDHFSISKAPLVTLSAAVPITRELGGSPAVFTVARTRGFEFPLTVQVRVGGTATAGLDYVALPESVTIPAFLSSLNVELKPFADQLFEGTETVTAQPVDAVAYRIERHASLAVASIKDEQWRRWRTETFGAAAGDRNTASRNADPDGDGSTNGEEFIAGTNPLDAQSFLRLRIKRTGTDAIALRFDASAFRGYSLLFKDSLSDPNWQTLLNIPPEPTERRIDFTDPASGEQPHRFYRIVAPQLP